MEGQVSRLTATYTRPDSKTRIKEFELLKQRNQFLVLNGNSFYTLP